MSAQAGAGVEPKKKRHDIGGVQSEILRLRQNVMGKRQEEKRSGAAAYRKKGAVKNQGPPVSRNRGWIDAGWIKRAGTMPVMRLKQKGSDTLR